ncbi:MAG: HlyD family efflux transporter periplasmic adaptor subunit [Bacteroidales bacterium]
MDPLEGTTLELIHRRRVSTFYPGYTIILLVLGIIVALPLVKVDVVSTSGGMIRPCQEPVELFSSITGIVDRTLIMDNLEVTTGDTLVWLRKNLPDTRMEELLLQIKRNRRYIKDIEAILRGEIPEETSMYMQSNRNHIASCRRLILQKEFLRDEYNAARILHDQQVIPLREFERARSEYQVSCAQLDDQLESYKNHLEDELNRLWMENGKYEGEAKEIRATLQNYYLLAPSTGTLNQCRGISPGSVIQAGISLGSISSHESLAADCYVETRDIREIRTGMTVRLRMDGKSQRTLDHLETRVSQIDPDVMLLNGRPVYRVRCMIGNPEGLIPGMTFSASMMLYRTSVASLMIGRLNRHFNPSLAQKPMPIH